MKYLALLTPLIFVGCAAEPATPPPAEPTPAAKRSAFWAATFYGHAISIGAELSEVIATPKNPKEDQLIESFDLEANAALEYLGAQDARRATLLAIRSLCREAVQTRASSDVQRLKRAVADARNALRDAEKE